MGKQRDPNERVELTPRQLRALDNYVDQIRDPNVSEDEKNGIRAEAMGYVTSAISEHRRS